MAKTTEQKIQELEIQTVRAVTELQKDVQNLTKEVSNLADQIEKMTMSYVTKDDYLKDYGELRAELLAAKKIGVIRTILFSVLATGITALVTYEIMKITR